MRRDLNGTTQGGDPARVRDKAIELLSLEYIDLGAQKLLRQSCQAMRDAICAEQARFVEFGLLRSITASGDGKTCATGREVAFVGEEYFLLSMLGIKTRQQALQGGKSGIHSCDIMTGEDSKGETVVSYFIIDRVLADEAKMLEPKKP
ncbi:MAG: hypothetical protein JWN16_457 [Alphaproteobacteria bacterium]|nr:hypothetical protein [Alphaproteobacteria bacterium]